MKKTITPFSSLKNTFGAIAIFAVTSVSAQTNVFDDVIATSPDHNYLEAALVQQGLDVTLQTATDLTVFAPTDQAFTDIATALDTDIDGLLALPNLTDILTYHVLGSVVPSSAVTNGLIAQPLSTTNTLKLTVTGAGGVFVNQAPVSAVDLNTDNGVVHVIDAVVLPVETVVDVALDNGFNALASAVIASELMPILVNPLATYTVFAPTDQAFQDLADLVGVPLSELFDPLVIPTASLQAVLGTHVLGSIVPSSAVTNGAIVDNIVGINTLKLTVKGSGEVFVNQAQVTTVDENSDNGVVHIINSV
ncbi:MAG: fasciclin domain-containing protein, partial [Crocinitomicaceae bacterium]|nr:fasciclin domain-containing protein [Crocinitomicaceae bacterium]